MYLYSITLPWIRMVTINQRARLQWAAESIFWSKPLFSQKSTFWSLVQWFSITSLYPGITGPPIGRIWLLLSSTVLFLRPFFHKSSDPESYIFFKFFELVQNFVEISISQEQLVNSASCISPTDLLTCLYNSTWDTSTMFFSLKKTLASVSLKRKEIISGAVLKWQHLHSQMFLGI